MTLAIPGIFYLLFFLLNSISRKIAQAAVSAVNAQPKETIKSAILAEESCCFIQLRCFWLFFSFCLQTRNPRLFLRQMNISVLSPALRFEDRLKWERVSGPGGEGTQRHISCCEIGCLLLHPQSKIVCTSGPGTPKGPVLMSRLPAGGPIITQPVMVVIVNWQLSGCFMDLPPPPHLL